MKQNTKKLTTIGILAGVSYVLMMILEFPLPFLPPFLKFDFSTVPALLAGFMFGPISGVLVGLIKSLLHLLGTHTGGVGELADFLCTATMVIPSALMYKKSKTRKSAIIGLCIGIAGLIIVSSLANVFLLLPMYIHISPKEALPYISSAILPFNLAKGIILSLVTVLLYKKVSNLFR